MKFVEWIKKNLAVFTFLATTIGAILGFVGGMVVSYYKVQSKFEVIDNSFEKLNYKFDLFQKNIKDEAKNTEDVFHLFYMKFDELKKDINQ